MINLICTSIDKNKKNPAYGKHCFPQYVQNIFRESLDFVAIQNIYLELIALTLLGIRKKTNRHSFVLGPII